MHFLLLVDDNRPACDALARLLRRKGYAAACVYGADEALTVLRDVTPDLVVLDWMMPGADGLEVLRRLRQDPATRGVPVMMYTAAGDAEVGREALRLGALDCVMKSGRINDLLERIECCVAAAARRGTAARSN
ncbi:MAG TPA: response regulator [Tepidisphaeraceae bacterium]|nr:response regulator [Tepidisphaeraceae bacterium]